MSDLTFISYLIVDFSLYNNCLQHLCIGYQTITDSIQVLSHIHFRMLLDYKCSTWYPTSVAERSKALTFLSRTGVVWVQIPLETHSFILNFSLPPSSEQVSPFKWNQAWPFTCSHSCLRIQIRLIIYKALHIHTCSMALSSATYIVMLYRSMRVYI